MKITEQDLRILCESGWTATDVAVHTGCPPDSILRLAKQFGLTLAKDKSRGHVLVRNKLRELLPGALVQEEYHIGGRLRLDFYLPHQKLAIEFDGVQHKQHVEFFHGSDREGFLDSQTRDRNKDNWCQEHGICLWRVADASSITFDNLAMALEQALALRECVPVQPEATRPVKSASRKMPKTTPEQKERQRQYRKEQYQKLKRMRDERRTAASD